MHLNKRGVALLQVLIIAAVLAGLATMILRVVMSRTLETRRTRQTVTTQMAIEACMKEVTEYWDKKFAEDPIDAAAKLEACQIEPIICPLPFPQKGNDQTLHSYADFKNVDGECTVRYSVAGAEAVL